jgi:hypothetical protein
LTVTSSASDWKLIAVPDTETAAGYAHSVEAAAKWLLQKLADPHADITYAVENLETSAQRGLHTMASGDVDRFAPGAVRTPPSGPLGGPTGWSDLDALGMVAAELNVAGTLLAASHATETDARPTDRVAFEQAIARLGATTRALEHDRDQPPAVAFAPVIRRSPDASAAAGKLRHQAESTLDAMAVRTAAVVQRAFSPVAGYAPDGIRNALKDLGEKLRIGQTLGRLASLALRLVEHALDRLSRFFPLRLLDVAREKVGQLSDCVGTGDLKAITAAVLDVTAAKQEIHTRLAASGLDRNRLDRGAADLTGLSRRFEHVMTMVDGVLVALVSAGHLLPLVGAPVPILPIFLSSAFLVAVAAVIMIGRDYVDSGSGLGFVSGVRHVVAGACGEAS